MSSLIHPQPRTTPKIRQEIKDSGLSSREAARVFNITRATAQKWLGRDNVQDRCPRTHTLHTPLSAAQEAIVLALRQSLYLPLDDRNR
jgi:transposase